LRCLKNSRWISESQVSDWILRGFVFIAKERESVMEPSLKESEFDLP